MTDQHVPVTKIDETILETTEEFIEWYKTADANKIQGPIKMAIRLKDFTPCLVFKYDGKTHSYPITIAQDAKQVLGDYHRPELDNVFVIKSDYSWKS